MKIVNFGSLNLDYVYQVPHFLAPGETLAATCQQVHPGGKGLNQSIAMARAGMTVRHAGMVGAGGESLVRWLAKNGVDTSLLTPCGQLQGNAVIQVNPQGQNCILLFGGSNQEVTPERVKQVLSQLEAGDWLVLQNEVSCLAPMLSEAKRLGLRVALNPSPYTENLLEMEMDAVAWLFINEVEGAQMTGCQKAEDMLSCLMKRWPHMQVILTLGEQGAMCQCGGTRHAQSAFAVAAVDTTAAGDTFTGFFLSAVWRGMEIPEAMRRACAASALCVSRPGASVSIPTWEETERWLAQRDAAEKA